MHSTTVWSLALLIVGTAASDRRLHLSYSRAYSISCPNFQYSGQERMRCGDCVHEQCGCDLKNSSSCCTRSYSCDSDEDGEDLFTTGSMGQARLIFLVMGITSTMIWRLASAAPSRSSVGRRLRHRIGLEYSSIRQRRMLLAQHQATLLHQVKSLSHPPPHHP